jgi:hypothetical protein
MTDLFTDNRLHPKRRCQKPGKNATAQQLREYNLWRKRKTYWRFLSRKFVSGVPYA